MVSGVCSWVVSRSSRRCVCAVIVASGLACGVWACSSPTQFETTPEFLQLEPAFFTVNLPTSENRIPDDSCPRALPKVAAGTRRTLSEIGATIELPLDTREIANAFGKQPGAAFLSPTLGLIAFGYDSYLPTVLRRVGVGTGSFGLPGQLFLGRWCALTINGVNAALFVDPFLETRGSELYTDYGGEFAIITTSPSGRRVNIRISANASPRDSMLRSRNGLPLVSAAAGIRW
jgi:hypothetical protein